MKLLQAVQGDGFDDVVNILEKTQELQRYVERECRYRDSGALQPDRRSQGRAQPGQE